MPQSAAPGAFWKEIEHMRRTLSALMAAAGIAGIWVGLYAQAGTPRPGDWPAYGRDSAGTKFSPLKQINTSNVSKLQRAWVYQTKEPGTNAGPETTPIVVGGVMYVSTAKQRVVALHPENGKEIWQFDPKVVGPTRENRGVSYWPGDGRTSARVLLATSDGRLISLDAETGMPAAEFGTNGAVNLRAGIMENYPGAMYSVSSPVAIYKNLAILGPELPEGPSQGPPGAARAFDLKTGKEVWSFRTVPRGGEPGSDTWGGLDGWKGRNGPSAWGGFTVDSERGLVFVPTANASDSFYGGDRKGPNLYSVSLLALDANTGKLKWYFQAVHHDVYDYDLNSPPTLVEVTQNGRKIPAVAQSTKMGLLFVLDRTNGKPIWGVEERPIAQSDVPGEQTSATQPFPLKPPPLARNSMTRDEVPHISPASDKFCQDTYDTHPSRGPYTPPSINGSVLFPGTAGGTGFGGVSYDPNLGYIFVNTQSVGQLAQMTATPPGTTGRDGRPAMPYRNTGGARYVDQDGYPCNAPPWGELAAVDMATGNVIWRVPLGGYPELEAKGLRNYGSPNLGGSIATAGGLLFIAATGDHMFRGFDSKTGKVLWTADLPATGNATPATYTGIDGKQYVVIYAAGAGHIRAFAGGEANADSFIAFRLP
jgi:glucose dehydrogenase